MAAFHFIEKDPPDWLRTDVQIINKFEDEQFVELLDIVFSFLRAPNKSGHLLDELNEFSGKYRLNNAALKGVVKSAVYIPTSALRKNLNTSQLREDFVNLGFSDNKAGIFAEKFEANRLSLSKCALSQTLMVNQLVDMEWKFGVTVGSSELDKIGNTFLQLKMTIKKGNRNENVCMEVTLPQFYAFLHEMERARASMEYFS